MVLHEDRHINTWKRGESPDINPCIHGQMIFNNDAKTIQWEQGQFFQQRWLRKLDVHMHKNEAGAFSFTI